MLPEVTCATFYSFLFSFFCCCCFFKFFLLKFHLYVKKYKRVVHTLQKIPVFPGLTKCPKQQSESFLNTKTQECHGNNGAFYESTKKVDNYITI